MNRFMKLAADEALRGVRKGDGGPFGAVVVRKGKVVAKAHNMVVKGKDPTAHAEIMAIRRAGKKLNRFNLSDCELYTTCESCPMCTAAIMWARIKKVYYGCTKKDAEDIGFDDKMFFDALKGKKKLFSETQTDRDECMKHFREWAAKKDGVRY